MKVRTSFGRYELGSKEEDAKRINFIRRMEAIITTNETEVFRLIIDMAIESEELKQQIEQSNVAHKVPAEEEAPTEGAPE